MGWAPGSLSGSEIPEATGVMNKPGKTRSQPTECGVSGGGNSLEAPDMDQMQQTMGPEREREVLSHPDKAGSWCHTLVYPPSQGQREAPPRA